MKKTKIITHSGKSHRDEFLSCCLVVAHEYKTGRHCVIERRVAGDADLGNRSIWVLDTGGVYDPSHRNFDHHQQAASEGTAKCSFDLVLMDLTGDSAYKGFCACNPWVKTTAVHDTLGSGGAADMLGIDFRVYAATASPVERYMLQAFSELPVVFPESGMMTMMREIGRQILCDSEEISTIVPERLDNAPAPFDHRGIRLWDIRNACCDDEHPTRRALVNFHATKRGVDVVIGVNSRTGQTGVYRQAWASKKLDLSILTGKVGVRFAHTNGFYAVVDNAVSDTNLIALIDSAIL